jgi:hypothetical protein
MSSVKYVGFRKDPGEWDRYFDNPVGPVGRHLSRRGTAISAAAKAQVGVRTGALRASIHMRHFRDPRGQYVRVGSDLPYAYDHHEGTKPHLIRPTRAEKLRFVSKGVLVMTHLVRHPGTPPNRFLSDNLHLVL